MSALAELARTQEAARAVSAAVSSDLSSVPVRYSCRCCRRRLPSPSRSHAHDLMRASLLRHR